MRAIREKLNSRCGASILMALLLLLVAIMVSVVIVSAAVSAAASVRSDRRQQQAYLTVSSAAELVRSSIETGSGGYSSTQTRVTWYSSGRTEVTTTPTPVEGKPFCELMNEAIGWVQQTNTAYAKDVLRLETDGFDPVNVTMTLSQKRDGGGDYYDLRMVFENENAQGNTCRMLLVMKGYLNVQQTSYSADYSKETQVLETTIRWDSGTITKEDIS